MSDKDREGMSKREYFREKRRQAELRNRLIVIGGIVLVAVVIVALIVLPGLKPVLAVQPAEVRVHPNAVRNSLGDPNAPVKLTEFADFQCPYCKQFWTDTETQVIDTYVKTGKVQYTYRSAGNFVSNNANQANGTNDTESQDAAEAAYCAADQGKFWEMHDALFTNVVGEANGTSFPAHRLQNIAQSIGLDMNAYNSCYSSDKYLSQVNQDASDAQAAGLDGTPFFVITYTANGTTQTATLRGAQPFSAFQQELDKDLAAAGVH
jgi:protein-disulfide isomerase